MTEIYFILGWVGWIWLGIVMILLPIALWAQAWLAKRRDRRRSRIPSPADQEVTANNEKQS